MFELVRRDGLARICRLDTPHGTLETPALLPVINPRNVTISPREMYDEFGVKALITNSYIIRNDVKIHDEALRDGLHALLDFPGVIMTDSGTFQSHMYGEVEVKNEEIVSFQRDIGSDIGTVLDIFTEPEWGQERASEAVDITLERTREAVEIKGGMLLAGVVQGSLFMDLRQRCASDLARIDCDVHPIGGVVPLMEAYRFTDLVEVIIASKKGLSPNRPVHLFGAGHPMVFALAALLGCDMFDSASYAKFARDGRFMFPSGTAYLKDMKELSCECPACAKETIDSIRKLSEEERTSLIARHNLHICLREIKRVRRAILEEDIWELAERRCRAHPALLNALRQLSVHSEFLEKFEPLSRDNSFFYTGPESLNRPSVLRYEKRFFERYKYPPNEVMVAFQEGPKPYGRALVAEMECISEECDAHFIVASPFGPVPIELDEIYPIAQSLFPNIADKEMEERTDELMERMSHLQTYSIGVLWEGEETLKAISPMCGGPSNFDIDSARIKAVANYQFGRDASNYLFNEQVVLAKSKTTGKIRNVMVGGDHILSMRAGDGFFTMHAGAAIRLMRAWSPPKMRVIVQDDSVPFNREGRNVFCGFVLDCDPNLRPMDEVMVVDAADNLIAIGRAMLTRDEMLSFKKGVAVKVREGIR